jgi:hypothetical protein
MVVVKSQYERVEEMTLIAPSEQTLGATIFSAGDNVAITATSIASESFCPRNRLPAKNEQTNKARKEPMNLAPFSMTFIPLLPPPHRKCCIFNNTNLIHSTFSNHNHILLPFSPAVNMFFLPLAPQSPQAFICSTLMLR